MFLPVRFFHQKRWAKDTEKWKSLDSENIPAAQRVQLLPHNVWVLTTGMQETNDWRLWHLV
jgi:hypothetical protein